MDPGEYAAVLRRAAARVVPDLAITVRQTLDRSRDIAQGWIGEEGSEPGWWPPFAEATVGDSRWMGPLERTGELKNSLHVVQEGLHGALSSSDPKIIYSELGTSHEPPRPFMKEAVRQAMREVGLTRLRFTLERVMAGEVV